MARPAKNKEDVVQKWSPYKFIDRICNGGQLPNEDDLLNFKNYLTQIHLSSDYDGKYLPFIRALNLKSFAKLPTEQQCRIYGTFRGCGFAGTFIGVKKNSKYATDEVIEKIMWAFNCNLERATRYSQDPRVDMSIVEADYNEAHGIY